MVAAVNEEHEADIVRNCGVVIRLSLYCVKGGLSQIWDIE
jgi:hypothetical protein